MDGFLDDINNTIAARRAVCAVRYALIVSTPNTPTESTERVMKNPPFVPDRKIIMTDTASAAMEKTMLQTE